VTDALRAVEEIHNAGGEMAAVNLGNATTAFGEFAMTLMLPPASGPETAKAPGAIPPGPLGC
jgi:hypothetical protein